MDDEIRELERQRERAPDDARASLRLARALERAGEVERAGLAYSRVVDVEPGNSEALRELDALTRGGVDPAAPWPCAAGDGRGSRRSRFAGPGRGAVVARVAVEGLKSLDHDFSVGREGELVGHAHRNEGEVCTLVAIAPSG